ncbi:uncharacterized protein TNCV_2481151 [Trichonephila clavipes]|nr:uncharacterized protein TNCV_2481151 [Trichonephila clavipes]
MAVVQDLKSALILDAANEASCRDSHSVRGARVTADAPCESPWIKEIEKQRGNSRFNSSTLKVEKKFGVIDPVIRKVTTPSTSELDPWSDDSVRKEQLADPEIKPIVEFKESSDEKHSWQDIAPFHPKTKRYRALWDSLHLRNVAAVAEWYRYRTVACFVTGSSPVPLKTRRVGQRCTLNLSRAETSSRWCGVVVRRGGCQLRCRPRHLTMVQNYVVRRQKPSCS